ncbi:MAG: zinc-binding dehydrogenase [Microbacteriaceae bacterium]|nr:zinc-binding dehydrogenase [Microbacteriaceae bacterium]
MKAARYYGEKDIRIEEVENPRIKFDDEVLVEPLYCGICGTDLHEYVVGPIVTPTSPHPLTGVTLPQTFGHEFSARVVEIGSAVHNVKVGDRVAIMPAIVCGRCDECRTGRGHLCRRFACTGLSAETGGLGELAVLKEYQVAVLPEEVTDIQGAVVEPALGASEVVVSDPNPERAAFAATFGLGRVVNPMDAGFDDLMKDITHGKGFDRTIECSGSTPGLQAGIEYTKRSGKIAQTGLHTKPATIDAMKLSEKDLSIVGNWCYLITDWPRIIRMAASGRYPIEKVVSSVIELDDVVTKGFDVLIDPNGNQMKVLTKVN